MPLKPSADELLRAQYIAKIKLGAGHGVLLHLEELSTEKAMQPAFVHIKALALAYNGALEQAIKLWESLYTEGLWSEELTGELAAAHLALSRPERAEALLVEWQEASGTPLSSTLAHYLIEALLAQQQKPQAKVAAALTKQYLTDKPQSSRIASARAATWLEDWTGVCQLLAPLTREDITLPAAAGILHTHGHLDESLAILNYAISVDPSSVETWQKLASAMWQSGDEDGAMGLLADAFEQFGDEPSLLETIAALCIDDRNFELAGLWVTRLEAELSQEDPRVRTLAAEVMLGLGDLQSVEDFFDSQNDSDETLDTARVSYYSRINQPEVAMYYQDRILLAKNRSVESLLARARLCAGTGQDNEAILLAKEVLERTPNSLAASSLLVAHQLGKVELEHLNRLRYGLHYAKMPARQRAWVSHALADYHHAIKDYGIAAELYTLCNKLGEPPPELRYDSTAHQKWAASTSSAFKKAALPVTKSRNSGDTLPVFVLGVPRSGTTLTEQMLSRHPDITGMGECQHVSLSFNWFMEQASPNITTRTHQYALGQLETVDMKPLRDRFLALLRPHSAQLPVSERHLFLDKMPDNYGLIGWIFTLFPEAKVIYARRDPREIALSCWKANFGAINWAYRMEDIAERIVQHHQTMKVWLDLFGERIFISDYAKLVTEPEEQTRKMLEYLELGWNSACLDHTRASSVVRTASVHQVRRPVFQTSLHSWQHYEKIMSPAIAIFENNGLV